MIWNHHKFTVNGSGNNVGDGNSDGVVDGSDFLIWNAAKFTGQGSFCIDDGTYEASFIANHGVPVANVPLNGFGGPPGTPVFSVASGVTDDLSVTIPAGYTLEALTVYSSNPALSYGPLYTSGGYVPVQLREEWTFGFSGPGGGTGLVASFAPGDLFSTTGDPSTVSVFWQVSDVNRNVTTGTTGHLWCVPEPSGGFLMMGCLGMLLTKLRNRRLGL